MPNEDRKINMGWSMIYLTVINTILNFIVILAAGICSIKLIIVKWYRRMRRFFDPSFMRIKTKIEIE